MNPRLWAAIFIIATVVNLALGFMSYKSIRLIRMCDPLVESLPSAFETSTAPAHVAEQLDQIRRLRVQPGPESMLTEAGFEPALTQFVSAGNSKDPTAMKAAYETIRDKCHAAKDRLGLFGSIGEVLAKIALK